MNDIKVLQGSVYPLTVNNIDDDVTNAELVVGIAGQTPLFTKNVVVVSNVATLDLDSSDTLQPAGEYNWQINLIYSDGNVKKLPELDGCSDCELPQFTICEALDEDVS